MPAQWTGDVVRRMHLAGVRRKELARALGYSQEYLGKILNGGRAPRGAQQTIERALDALLAGRSGLGATEGAERGERHA